MCMHVCVYLFVRVCVCVCACVCQYVSSVQLTRQFEVNRAESHILTSTLLTLLVSKEFVTLLKTMIFILKVIQSHFLLQLQVNLYTNLTSMIDSVLLCLGENWMDVYRSH